MTYADAFRRMLGGTSSGEDGLLWKGGFELCLDAADEQLLEFARLDVCACCGRREEPDRYIHIYLRARAWYVL